MARIWHLGEVAVRPGTYFRTSSGDVTTVGAVNGVLAVVYRSNWGELNKVVDISPEEMNNLTDIVGTGKGYDAIREGFIGGATMVKAVRIGSGGAKARVVLKSTPEEKEVRTPSTTPGEPDIVTKIKVQYNAVKIYARHYGDRKFTATLRLNPLLNGTKQLLIYDENNRIIENVSYEAGGNEPKRLIAALSSSKNFYGVEMNPVWHRKLAYTTQKKFSKGKDPKVTVANYAEGTDALERYYWNVIVADSHSTSVNAIMTAFVKQSYENGHLGMTVLAGTKSTPFEDRMAYAASTNDWRVVYLLNGWKSNAGVTYNGWRAAARIGGMVAACETNASLTHIVVQDALKLLENFTNGQMIRAEEKGCMVLSLNDEDQVWIDNSINTLVTLGNDQDEGWKKIRRTKCRFELMTRINRTCDKLVGRLNNDANGRATLVTAMNSVIREMIGERKLFEGSYAAEDTRYKPVADRAYFVLHIGDIDSLEKIYLGYKFSHANPFSELDSAATA